jgi:hypothetical protein
MSIEETIHEYVTKLSQLTTGPLSRQRVTQMQEVLQQLGDQVEQAGELLRGRVDLTGDLWPEVDDIEDEETDAMDQKERDQLLLYRDAIDDRLISIFHIPPDLVVTPRHLRPPLLLGRHSLILGHQHHRPSDVRMTHAQHRPPDL